MPRKAKKGSEKREYGTVSLPMPLIEAVKKNIEGTGIHSVLAYVSFILRQIMSESKNSEVLDATAEKKIKSRLKSLGYL
jgi:hypothetical protein